MKTITVEDEIWKKLCKSKIDLNLSTISEVIERLFKIVEKIENAEKRV